MRDLTAEVKLAGLMWVKMELVMAELMQVGTAGRRGEASLGGRHVRGARPVPSLPPDQRCRSVSNRVCCRASPDPREAAEEFPWLRVVMGSRDQEKVGMRKEAMVGGMAAGGGAACASRVAPRAIHLRLATRACASARARRPCAPPAAAGAAAAAWAAAATAAVAAAAAAAAAVAPTAPESPPGSRVV